MNDEELKRALRELQQELLGRNDLNEEQIARIKLLRTNIDEFLTRQEEHSAAKDLAEYVLRMETEFSIRHPVLDGFFRETLNTLNRIGV